MARNAALAGRVAGLTFHPLPMPALPVEPSVTIEATDRGRRKGQGPADLETEALATFPSRASQIRLAALMEHLGSAAAGATATAEADALVSALVPLAFGWLPENRTTVAQIAPALIRGAASISRILGRRRVTRPLLRLLPSILRRTVGLLARARRRGEPVTPARAAQLLARQAAWVIGDPRRCVTVYRRSRALDSNFHRSAARRMSSGFADYAEGEGFGLSVPCPLDSCAQTRDPDTGLIICVDRGCSNGCELRNTWLGAMCCCK
jgi:hypothetical protein